jgi:hypothetical protein
MHAEHCCMFPQSQHHTDVGQRALSVKLNLCCESKAYEHQLCWQWARLGIPGDTDDGGVPAHRQRQLPGAVLNLRAAAPRYAQGCAWQGGGSGGPVVFLPEDARTLCGNCPPGASSTVLFSPQLAPLGALGYHQAT